MANYVGQSAKTSVGSSVLEYDSMRRIWGRSRAIINGELAAKSYDNRLDTVNYSNLLVPFSPQMKPAQFKWYVSEAELPGLVSQYARVLVGGLLRKPPSILLPENIPQEALTWLKFFFTEDKKSIISFLDEAIWEELSTSRAWVSVDFPVVEEGAIQSQEDRDQLFPFPLLWKAEEIINWQQKTGPLGIPVLSRVVIRYIDKVYDENPFHPRLVPTVVDHYLDENNEYTVDHYISDNTAFSFVSFGEYRYVDSAYYSDSSEWTLHPNKQGLKPKMHGRPINFLPVFPLNGDLDIQLPILTPLIDREISLYNKMSRRNHLLYGAATYTPVLFTDMRQEDFEAVVNAGLGSWIKLGPNDRAETLKSPVEALEYMEKSIEQSVSELSRMGIRILSPDSSSNDSGIALEIRNSSQTAQLGVLNTKISETLKRVVYTMLMWKYDIDISIEELDFTLSADFNPSPLGADWMKLVTEWYENRLIPRSIFIKFAKENDIIPSDYDDEKGIEELQTEELPAFKDKDSIRITDKEEVDVVKSFKSSE